MHDKPTICMAEEGCHQPIYGRGLCSRHYQQARKDRIPFPLVSQRPLPCGAAPAERFWIKVNKDGPIPYDMTVPYAATPCWIWTAAKMKEKGYGIFTIGHDNLLAHHFLIGKPPQGFETDHLCFIRNCVRPDHLEIVTRKQNIVRQRAHGRARQEFCGRGHNEWRDLPDGRRQCGGCVRENMRAHRERKRNSARGE